jgi:hypothetical protein
LRLIAIMNLGKAGRSALIAAGAGFGFLRGLRIIGDISQTGARLGNLEARIDTLHVAVSHLADQAEQVQAEVAQRVTRADLGEAIARACERTERGLDERFERQGRSVEALRLMVGQTDELLQRVLEGIEKIQHEQSGEAHEAGWEVGRSRN